MDEYKLHNTYRWSQAIHKTFYSRGGGGNIDTTFYKFLVVCRSTEGQTRAMGTQCCHLQLWKFFLKSSKLNNRLTPFRTLKFEPSSFNGFEYETYSVYQIPSAFKNNCEREQLPSSRLSAGHNSISLDGLENNLRGGFFFFTKTCRPNSILVIIWQNENLTEKKHKFISP